MFKTILFIGVISLLVKDTQYAQTYWMVLGIFGFIFVASNNSFKKFKAEIETTKAQLTEPPVEQKRNTYLIEFASTTFVGVYKDEKIREFILIKHPSKPDVCLRYDFNGIINSDDKAKYVKTDEVFFESGLIYKNSNIEIKRPNTNGSHNNS